MKFPKLINIIKYYEVKLTADNFLNKDFIIDGKPQCSNNSRRKVKLSTIEFKKFEGEIKNSLRFWSQYQQN